MKCMLPYLFLCCFINFSLAIACGDNGPCDYRKYGYRRALLKNPDIFIQTDGSSPVSTSYKDYFEELATQAKKLREHLIKTGALEKSNEEKSAIRKVAAMTLENSLVEFSAESLKKYVNSSQENLTPEFCKKVQKKAQKIKEDIDSKKNNIASFGFVFFGQDGNPLNEKPFHFSTGGQGETYHHNLTTPFFFLSGRKQWNYQQSHGFHPWDALPQGAPTNTHLLFRPSPPPPLPPVENLFQGVLKKNEQEDIKDSYRKLKQAHNEYTICFKEALLRKTQEQPFFNHIYTRYMRQQESSPLKVCPDLLRLLELPTYRLPNRNYYPEKPDQHKPNREGDFTHSEQWALFQAACNHHADSSFFESFIDACVNELKLPHGKTVESYAILIYSYNVICVRCAQSIIIDFTISDELSDRKTRKPYVSLNQLINKKLNKGEGGEEQKQRPMVFMAGYTNPYRSELYSFSEDYYESQLPKEGKIPVPNDKTLGKFYKKCVPEANPQMIYHVKIDNIPSNNSCENKQNSLDEEDINNNQTQTSNSQDLINLNHSFVDLEDLRLARKQAAEMYSKKFGYLSVSDEIFSSQNGQKYVRIKLDGSKGDCCFHALGIGRRKLIESIQAYISECETELKGLLVNTRVCQVVQKRDQCNAVLTTAKDKDVNAFKGHNFLNWSKKIAKNIQEQDIMKIEFAKLINLQKADSIDWEKVLESVTRIKDYIYKITSAHEKLILYEEFVGKCAADFWKRVGPNQKLESIKSHLQKCGVLDAAENQLRIIENADLENDEEEKIKSYIKYTFEFLKATEQRKNEILTDFYLTNNEWLDPSAILHLGPRLGIKAKLFKKDDHSQIIHLNGQTPNCNDNDGETCRLMLYVDDSHYDLLFPINSNIN